MLICIVGMGVYVAYVLSSASAVQSSVRSSLITFPLLQLITNCRQQADDMRAYYATVISSNDNELLQPAQAQAEVTKQTIAELIALGHANGRDDSQLATAFDVYRKTADSWAQDDVNGSIVANTGQDRIYEVAMAQKYFNQSLDQIQKDLYHQHDNQLNGVQKQAKMLTLVGLIGGILLSFLLFMINAGIIRRLILRPLDRAVDAANRIEIGDWSSSVIVHGRDEIGKLLGSMENLRSHLLMQREAVERHSMNLQNELQQRQQAEIQLSKLSKAIENSAAGIFIANARGLIEYANPKLLMLIDHDWSDVIGQPCASLLNENISEERWEGLNYGHEWRGEFRILRRDGSSFWALVSLAAMFNENHQIINVVGNIADVSLQKESEEVINRLAFYDSLTELPNRRSLIESLPKFLDQAIQNGKMIAVCYLDLDRFKDVNDTLGHAVGDSLLLTAAQRLQSVLRKDDFVARLGGDEFALIISNLDSVDGAVVVAHKIIERMTSPFKLEGRELIVTASMGVAFFPEHGINADRLLKCADIALYLAKDAGRNNFKVFSEEQEGTGLAKMEMEAQIRRSLQANDFFLEYQPKYSAKTGEMCGAEALIRWQHPSLGRLAPDRFISLAEETRLIVPLGNWIIEEVVARLASWRDQGLDIVPIAVNLSTVQFANGELPDYIANTLKRHQLDPALFDVEITESLLMILQVVSLPVSFPLRGRRQATKKLLTTVKKHSSKSHLRQSSSKVSCCYF
ncbi:MAG: diguanylate cyclase [Candidatus Saccharibacteria bacterium]|nr:diguanylate cyclase [Moraxellaceae bacterium]